MTSLCLTVVLLVLGATSLHDSWWRRASRFCLLWLSFWCAWSLINEVVDWAMGGAR
ncbi:hypothetical protein ACIOHS_26990 [Streptomyces sp. NPDC088253]|uniref:hypothetical protein n=1 Tax=Streptomyces sp. NPDC088253 TaxID=3365846 RepID=UPI0037FB9FE7